MFRDQTNGTTMEMKDSHDCFKENVGVNIMVWKGEHITKQM